MKKTAPEGTVFLNKVLEVRRLCYNKCLLAKA